MILDRHTARTAIANSIAFNQSTDQDIPRLSPVMTDSTSMFNVSAVHPLLNLENIDASVSYFDRFNYPFHSATAVYNRGDVVALPSDDPTYPDAVFQAIQEVPASTALSDTDYWFQMDGFNQHLHAVLMNSADKALNAVVNSKTVRMKTKSSLEKFPLFDGMAHKKYVVPNQNKFVGMRFVVKGTQNVSVLLPKVTVQFSDAVTFKLYLFHTNQEQYIASTDIAYTKRNSVQYFDLNWKLVNGSILEELNGGEYYIGYKQSDLEAAGVEALKMKDLNWSQGHRGCVGCGNRSNVFFQNYSKFVDIEAFSISEDEFDPEVEIFDPERTASLFEENYGLNFWVAADCDITSMVANDPFTYAEATTNVAGLELLKSMASSVRNEIQLSNAIQTQAQKEIVEFTDVQGNVAEVTRLSLEALSFDLSSLDSICLKCDDGKPTTLIGTVTLM